MSISREEVEHVAHLARLGLSDEEVGTLQEQLSERWLGAGAAKALADTSAFLKEQGRVQQVLPSYEKFVTKTYAQKAQGQ